MYKLDVHSVNEILCYYYHQLIELYYNIRCLNGNRNTRKGVTQIIVVHQATYTVEDGRSHVTASVEVVVVPKFIDVVVHSIDKKRRSYKIRELVMRYFQVIATYAIEMAVRAKQHRYNTLYIGPPPLADPGSPLIIHRMSLTSFLLQKYIVAGLVHCNLRLD